jgi:hypothetical protein
MPDRPVDDGSNDAHVTVVRYRIRAEASDRTW